MSQLFDSLRRPRHPAPASGSPARRTAHGDAVLATLGYAPAGRGPRMGPLLVRGALIAGIAVAAFVVWKESSGSGAVTPAARRPSTPRPSPTPPRGAAAPPSSPATSPAVIPPPATAMPVDAPVAKPVAEVLKPAAPVVREAPNPAPSVSAPPIRPGPAAPSAAAPSAAASSSPGPALGPNAFELALYYHRAGDFENALLQYRALLQANQLNAQAHNNLGLLYQEKNLLDDSARELQRAIIIEPGYTGAHTNYGVTLLRQGKLDAAAAQFRTVLTLEPRNVDARVNLALVEKASAQAERAKQSLLLALSVAPKSAAAHYNLAVLYEETGELSRAVEHYRAFLDTVGAEYADRAPAVRARLAALAR